MSHYQPLMKAWSQSHKAVGIITVCIVMTVFVATFPILYYHYCFILVYTLLMLILTIKFKRCHFTVRLD